MTTVVTGFDPSGFQLYGKNFLKSFDHHWPADIDLVVYAEDLTAVASRAAVLRRNKFEIRDVFRCGGLRDFLDRNRGIPARCGREPTARWKGKERAKGYSYRFDAVKFSKQLFYPHDAAQSLPDGEILAWFDADVVTFADVPDGLIESLIENADIVYLGRKNAHSEIGFWAVRLNYLTREFLKQLAMTYATEDVFALAEWHSAFVFDHCMKGFKSDLGVAKNLTPDGAGHVWFQTVLGKYTDHLKGKRKLVGRSRERRS